MTPEWIENPWTDLRVLQLGCGRRPMSGAVNHDRTIHSDGVDVEWDLDQMPWPSSLVLPPLFDVVVALDVLEHVEDVLGFMNECHALLADGGLCMLRAGHQENPASYVDPTHKHWFTEESLDFFDRSTRIGDHYGRYYVDSLGRPLTEWKIQNVLRVNADPRWSLTPDVQFVLRRV